MGYNRCRRGFTLIELLVAIGILAMVAVLGWRGLDGIVRARVALTAELEQTHGLQMAFAQLQSDAEHLASAASIGGRPTLAVQDGRLTLIRTVFVDDQPSRLQVVAYRVQDGVLSRRESAATRDTTVLDALWQRGVSDIDAAPAVALQDAVSGMAMRLWLSDGPGWQANWGSAASTGVPRGLEVVLQTGAGLRMTKIFLLGAS